MNKPALNQLKNKPVFKIAMGILIVLLVIKLGSAGYEFGHWLKTR